MVKFSWTDVAAAERRIAKSHVFELDSFCSEYLDEYGSFSWVDVGFHEEQ